MDIITSRNLRDFDEKGFFIVGQKVSGEWLDKLTKECEKYNSGFNAMKMTYLQSS